MEIKLNRQTHFIFISLLCIIILVLGTFGYMIIEGWNLVDSLYMTVITVATVGFAEINQISCPGRIFTMFLIFLGVGFFTYVAGAVAQLTVEGRLREILGRRRLDKQLSRLRNHYIICGFGRIGHVLYQQLMPKLPDIVVIEKNENLVQKMEETGFLYVLGSATEEKNLMKAGVKYAKGLVAVLGADADNVFLVLTARQLNPDLYIVARACNESSKKILIAAGADRVDSPYDIGAVRMAQSITQPTVINFLDYAFAFSRKEIQMEEILISSSSELVNLTLMESGIRKNFDLIIIAIKSADGTMIFNPASNTKLYASDTVIALGKSESLIAFQEILAPKDSEKNKSQPIKIIDKINA